MLDTLYLRAEATAGQTPIPEPGGAIIATPLDWNDLRYLLAVHRRGSVARAAKELGVTKATASRRLAALEEALGARLFERHPSGLVLTAAGSAALQSARGMEDAYEELRARVASAADDEPRGTVRLTAPQWLAERMILGALAELKAQHAELDVQLVGTNQLLNLAQREADVAIRNVKPPHQSLVSRKVCDLGGSVYASRLYLERRGVPASRESLEGHDVLAYEGLGGMPGFEWLRDPALGGKIAFRANDPAALVGAATAGLGLAAVPCLLGDAEPSLQRVPTLGFSTCDLLVVTHAEGRATPRIRAVIEFVLGLAKRHRAVLRGVADAVGDG